MTSSFSCHLAVQKYALQPCLPLHKVIRFQSFRSHPYLLLVTGILSSPPPPQSNSDMPPSRMCPPLPNPRQKWNELWHFNDGGCHPPGETEKRQSSTGTSATWLCPMYPEYFTLHLPLPPAHWTLLSSHPPSHNVHLHVFTFWGVGVPSQKAYPFHLLI